MNSLHLPKLIRDVDLPKFDSDVDLDELDFEVFPWLMNSLNSNDSNEDPDPLLINSDETNNNDCENSDKSLILIESNGKKKQFQSLVVFVQIEFQFRVRGKISFCL